MNCCSGTDLPRAPTIGSAAWPLVLYARVMCGTQRDDGQVVRALDLFRGYAGYEITEATEGLYWLDSQHDRLSVVEHPADRSDGRLDVAHWARAP